MNTIAVIVARLNSSRLKGKHFLPLPSNAQGGTLKLIDHIIRRLNKCTEIDEICLATTAEKHNQPLLDWAGQKGLYCPRFEGDPSDVVGRVDAIVEECKPDFVAFISGDCPLIDPAFIDSALFELKKTMSDSVSLADSVKSLHEGMDFFSFKGWKKLVQNSKNLIEREHVGYQKRHHSNLKITTITDVYDFSKITHRISVDTKADYDFIYEIYKRWYSQNSVEKIVDLRWVQNQIVNDKQLSALNQHVVQRNALEKYESVNLYCHVSKDIGLGHFKRCEIIASTLTERLGLGVCIHAYSENKFKINPCIPVTFYNSEKGLKQAMNQDNADIIIIDFNLKFLKDPNTYKTILKNLKKTNKSIVGIDNLYPFIDALHFLYVPSFQKQIDNRKVISGWDTYLFKSRARTKKSKTILILTGGSDALGYGKVLPEILENYETFYEIIWVQGPLADRPVLKNKSNIKLIYDPNDITDLLERAEIVISAYGISFFEALFRECATILLPSHGLISQDEMRELEKVDCCLIARTLPEVIYRLKQLEENTLVRDNILHENRKNFKDKTGLDKFTCLIDYLRKL